MFEVTDSATQQISEYFTDKDVKPIRVFLNEGGWGGPSLALALDEQKESDETYEVGGYTYLVDKVLLEKAAPVKIDFTGFGFKIDCSMEFSRQAGCSGCGTSNSGGCGV